MRIGLFGLILAIGSLSGCAQMAVVQETAQGRAPEQVIASDLVNILMQVDGYHPVMTRLQMQEPTHRFGKTLNKVLETAGYDIQRVSSPMGERFVEYTFSNRQNSQSSVPQTYQLSVGDVQIKRDYSFSLGRVQPASDLYVAGVDASNIQLNDHIFSIGGEQTPPSIAPASESIEAAPSPIKQNDSSLQHVGTRPSNKPVAELSFELLVNGESTPRDYSPGDKLVFTVKTPVDTRLSCYYQGPEAGIIRIYPNRFTINSVVNAGVLVHIPSTEEWAIEASQAGASDQVLCASVDPALETQMSLYESTPDFEVLPVNNFAQLVSEIEQATGIAPQTQRVSVLVN